jgi:hypothetical protein
MAWVTEVEWKAGGMYHTCLFLVSSCPCPGLVCRLPVLSCLVFLLCQFSQSNQSSLSVCQSGSVMTDLSRWRGGMEVKVSSNKDVLSEWSMECEHTRPSIILVLGR